MWAECCNKRSQNMCAVARKWCTYVLYSVVYNNVIRRTDFGHAEVCGDPGERVCNPHRLGGVVHAWKIDNVVGLGQYKNRDSMKIDWPAYHELKARFREGREDAHESHMSQHKWRQWDRVCRGADDWSRSQFVLDSEREVRGGSGQYRNEMILVGADCALGMLGTVIGGRAKLNNNILRFPTVMMSQLSVDMLWRTLYSA